MKTKLLDIVKAPVELTIHSLFFTEEKKRFFTDNEHIGGVNAEFFIYKANFNDGGIPIYIYSEEKLVLGDIKLNLKWKKDFVDLNIPTEKLKEICRIYGKTRFKIGDGETIYQKVYDFLDEKNKKEKVFYEICPPFDMDLLLKLEDGQIQRFINDYVSLGYHVDERLNSMFSSFLPRFSMGRRDSSKRIQPFSPHAIIITNTKTGKTSMAERVGVRYDSVRISRLLGFSTAETVSRGDLDGGNKTVIIDELQEEELQEMYGKLLTFMETGISKVGKGSKTINIRSCSPLVFISNPKIIESKGQLDDYVSNESLMLQFAQFLNKITTNYRAFGSRVGFVAFGNNYSVIKDFALFSEEDEEKCEMLAEYLMKYTETYFSKIMNEPEIRVWLNKPYPKEIISEINALSEGLIQNVKEFWTGFSESHRHLRGGALRLALLDSIENIIKLKKPKTKDIINKAETYFTNLLEINFKSLENMSKIGISDTMKDLFLQNIFNTKISEALCKAIAKTYMSLSEEEKKLFLNLKKVIAIPELQNAINELEDEEKGRYKFISKIMEAFSNHLMVSMKKIGVYVNKSEKYINIADKDKFITFINILYNNNTNNTTTSTTSSSYFHKLHSFHTGMKGGEKTNTPTQKCGSVEFMEVETLSLRDLPFVIKEYIINAILKHEKKKENLSYADLEIGFQKKYGLKENAEELLIFYKIFCDLKEKGVIFEPKFKNLKVLK